MCKNLQVCTQYINIQLIGPDKSSVTLQDMNHFLLSSCSFVQTNIFFGLQNEKVAHFEEDTMRFTRIISGATKLIISADLAMAFDWHINKRCILCRRLSFSLLCTRCFWVECVQDETYDSSREIKNLNETDVFFVLRVVVLAAAGFNVASDWSPAE